MAVITFVAATATLPRLFAWDVIYTKAHHRWRYGARSFHFQPRDAQETVRGRVAHVLNVLLLEYEMAIGMSGRHFRTRGLVAEIVEVFTQLNGVLFSTDSIPNSTLQLTLVMVVINVLGTWLLAAVPRSWSGKELRSTFDLAIDMFWVAFNSNAVVVESAGLSQVLALAVPILFVASSLRVLGYYHVFAAAKRDCMEAHIPGGVAIHSHTNIFTKHRLRGFGTVVKDDGDDDADGDDETRSPWSSARALTVGALGYLSMFTIRRDSSASSVSSYGSDDGTARERRLKRARVWNAVGVALAALVSCGCVVALLATTLHRLDATEAHCRELVGGMWDGVHDDDRLFFRNNGLFGEATCGLEHITVLDLRGSSITRIDERVLHFSSVEDILASDCPNLAYVGPEVNFLANLQTLDLTGSPAARSLVWRDAGLTSLHAVLWQQSELRELDVSGNRLETIPASMPSLAKLERLNASGNLLDGRAIVALGPLRNLMSVNLANNSIIELPVDAASVRVLRRWTSLDLRYNAFTNVHEALFDPKKDELRLEGTAVRRAILASSNVGPALPTDLFVLPLEQFTVWASVINTIDDSILRVADTLHTLEISSSAISHNYITPSLVQMSALHELGLDQNALADNDGFLPEVLFRIPTLAVLRLSCTNMRQLSPVAWESPSLRALEIKNNRLTSLPPVPASVVEAGSLDLRVLNLRMTDFDGVPEVVLQPPLADTLQVFTISGKHWDANAINASISVVEAATGGRLRCREAGTEVAGVNCLYCREEGQSRDVDDGGWQHFKLSWFPSCLLDLGETTGGLLAGFLG
uniref:Uncharacterized protein n=1 Tax=Bicosoecida sp. CB-2014 TaxID=1486930 RepID=A0A7S1G332_9STRA